MRNVPHLIHATALVLVGSLSAWLGVLFPALWFLAPLGLAVFFYVLWFWTHSLRSAFFFGAFFGIATGGAGVWWMWDMFPLQTPLSLSVSGEWTLIALVWGLTALLAGLATGIAAIALYLSRTSLLAVPLAGIVWVLQENARMWFFALYSYSPESLFGPHFSQTSLGYSLAEAPYVLSLAYPFGITALNFAVALISASSAFLARAILKKEFNRQSHIALCSLLALVLVLIIPHPHPTQPHFRVAVLSATATTTNEELKNLFEESAEQNPPVDAILFPEGTAPDFISDTTYLKKLFGTRDVLIVSSTHGMGSSTSLYAEILYNSTQNGRLAEYKKIFLMPQGEYMPTIGKFLFPLSGEPNALSAAEVVGKRLLPGNQLVAVPFKSQVIGGLLCSEIISPYLYSTLAEKFGATLLVNLSDPSWFHASRRYADKMLQIAKVHAVQNNLYFIQATRDAPSFILNPEGRVIEESAWDTANVLYANVGR